MDDKFHGQGGSYVVDPKTGEKKLVERTDAPQPEPAPKPAPKNSKD